MIQQNLVQILFQRWQKLQQHGGTGIVTDAATRSRYWQDKTITFHLGKKTVQGIFLGINQDGSILLQEPDGTQNSYFSGEILY